MKKNTFLIILLSILFLNTIKAQDTDANIFGDVQTRGDHIPFVSIFIKGTNIGTATDQTGHYLLVNLPTGKHTIVAKMLGYKVLEKEVDLVADQSFEVNFELKKESMAVDEVVITGTKTFKRKTESAVIVNVIDSKVFDFVQANTISEGLNFQPGLRMETDCQTCNYSQLRMNGLGGAYSQILINSRPIFSPLTGLYGLEQIPTEMVERIEVVRGGASALYGSSAIGGTVNVITRFPSKNAYEFSVNNGVINGEANDNHINGNITLLTPQRNAGVTIFTSRRDRQSYDHNGDGYSEMPLLQNNSFGMNSYFKLSPNQKLEANLASLHEYRRGGNKNDGAAAHLSDQSEERTHDILMGGLDYEINFDNNRTSLSVFLAGQNTKRKHYTGIIPDDPAGIQNHYENPPYGVTDNNTFIGGVQVNHTIYDFIRGTNVITGGFEYNYDDVFDEIKAYNYVLDQTSKNFGLYLQSDWAINPKLTLLSGFRADKHNLVDKLIVNPRFSVLYKSNQETQFRMSWSTGFRAPQAFDSDMHIAFAGGGIQQIQLADNLDEERSQSISTSMNWDHATEQHIWGFTIEGFYTLLKESFILEEISQAGNNSVLEKRNGGNSEVFGATFEARSNFNRILQIEAGLTIQKSQYDTPIEWSADISGTKDYLRAPETYGYFTVSYTPESPFTASLSGIYTGEMLIPHYGLPGDSGTPEVDILKTSDSFIETNLKFSYDFDLSQVDSKLQLFAGVSNIFNAYQDDFDSGKFRDSNYIYGPAKPRTIFFGLKIFN